MTPPLTYKINGFDLYKALGILTSADRVTVNSFEAPNDVKPAFSHDWQDENGIEYDTTSPVYLQPRVFTIKGTISAIGIDNYNATKMALKYLLYQPYVTIEVPAISVKVNAKLKPGGIKWERQTHLAAYRILANVQFQFDEIMQTLPFIDLGIDSIQYLIDSQGRFYNTQDNKFLIT